MRILIGVGIAFGLIVAAIMAYQMAMTMGVPPPADGALTRHDDSVRTIATNDMGSVLDWPCFADKAEFEVWLANSGDDQKEQTIEDNNAIWLEHGDTVKVLSTEGYDGSTVHVRILKAPTTASAGKTCWVSTGGQNMFEQ